MSICTPCLQAKAVPTCTTLLTIGSISTPNVAIAVYLWDITTGLLITFATTSGAGGEVVVDLTQASLFANHTYEVTVSLASAAFNEWEQITIQSETKEVVCMRFVDVKNEDGTAEGFAEAELILS